MKSFLQGKKCLEVSPLRPPVGASTSLGPNLGHHHRSLSAPATSSTSAQVEVVKEGGKVVRLIVMCACGERVEIDCLYAAGS
jgi:hypothetical protein